MPRLSADVVILLGLLLLFAILSFNISGPSDDQDPLALQRRSSFNTAPAGWKAYYNLLERRKNTVDVWERRPKLWPADASVIITGPYSVGGIASRWDRGEARDALHWVAKGGTLIAFTDADDALTRALGVSASFEDAKKDVKKNATSPLPDDDSEESDDDTPETITIPAGPKGSPLTIRQPVIPLNGVQGIVTAGEKRYVQIPASAVTLLADYQPVAVAIPYGNGNIIAICDAGIIDNGHLADGDNARFAVQLAETFSSDPKRNRILFDEYHQNYQESESLWTVIGHPGQMVFWQLFTLALLMVYSYSRRFGLPRPVPAPPRVSSEYVRSLADLYHRARASDAALESIYNLFWRDLCRAAGTPLETDARTVAVTATARVGASEAQRTAIIERIIRVIAECRAKIETAALPPPTAGSNRQKRAQATNTLSESDMLRLTLEIEALRKELEFGRADSKRTGL